MTRVGAVLSREHLVGYARLGSGLVAGGSAEVPAGVTVGVLAGGASLRYERTGPLGVFDSAYTLLECDLVLSEGAPGAGTPTVLLLDEGGQCGADPEPAGDVVATVGVGRGPMGRRAPDFHPSDLEGIAQAVLSRLSADAEARPLYGLVLAGGRSTRMGRPKWQLDYRGEPHALHLLGLLDARCERSFLSIRPEQGEEPALASNPHIVDAFPGLGPLSGILSAMTLHPEAAWVVLACDLPGVSVGTIERLLAARAPLRFATCYESPVDGLPEPLVAVYEPKARLRLFQLAALGHSCPRKMLLNSRTLLLESAEGKELANVNYPGEYEQAVAHLRLEEA